MKILRQAKTSYYGNLDINSVTGNKRFWTTVKPLFTEKVQTSSSITLIENEKFITNDSEIAEIQSQENITVARPLTGGRSTKTNRSSYDTPKPHLFLLFCGEGLPSGMFLSGGSFNNFSGLC